MIAQDIISSLTFLQLLRYVGGQYVIHAPIEKVEELAKKFPIKVRLVYIIETRYEGMDGWIDCGRRSLDPLTHTLQHQPITPPTAPHRGPGHAALGAAHHGREARQVVHPLQGAPVLLRR